MVKTISGYLSDKIKVVSFILIVMVLYLHAGLPEEVMEAMMVPKTLRTVVAGVFCPCAVPLFYSISGFLFFNGLGGGQ